MTNGPGDRKKEKQRRPDSGPTEFPRSARPIYIRMGLLILIVAGLCIIAEQCGDPALMDDKDAIIEVPGMKLPFELDEEEEEDYEDWDEQS